MVYGPIWDEGKMVENTTDSAVTPPMMVRTLGKCMAFLPIMPSMPFMQGSNPPSRGRTHGKPHSVQYSGNRGRKAGAAPTLSVALFSRHRFFLRIIKMTISLDHCRRRRISSPPHPGGSKKPDCSPAGCGLRATAELRT